MSFFERVASCVNVQQALTKYAHAAKDVGGIVQAYGLKPKDNSAITCEYPNHPWQQELLKQTMGKAPPSMRRKVIWIYDPMGNTGKSQLARYLGVTYPEDWYVLNGVSATRDVSTIISNAIAHRWNGHGILIDIPRSETNRECQGKRDLRELYVSIETLKNGTVTATKYSGETIFFNCDWLVVMSNWLPDVESLSLDRWDIRHLDCESLKLTSWTAAAVSLARDRDEKQAKSRSHDLPSLPTNSGLFPS